MPDTRYPIPAVILVRPQLGENIGAAARAMSNFGLKELRLVAPRDGWPNKRALETASGGESIIETAKAYPDLPSAMADIHFAYAATARPRDMEKRVITPGAAAQQMSEIRCQMSEKDNLTSNLRHPASAVLRTALVFGPERTGLENEDLAWCDALITIPTAPKNSSLNLAQSVVVLGYEWWKARHPVRAGGEAQDLVPDPAQPLRGSQDDDTLATKQDWHGLFAQLETYLDEINYYRVSDKKPIMWQNLRNMLQRGQWSAQEVRTFRGMLRALWERKMKNR